MNTFSIEHPSGNQYELDWHDDNAPTDDQLGDILDQHTGLPAPDSWDQNFSPNTTHTSYGGNDLTNTQTMPAQGDIFRGGDAHWWNPTPPAKPTLFPKDNPNGRGVVVYVNGSFSDHTAWTQPFVDSVNKTFTPVHQEVFDWDRSGAGETQTGMAMSDIKGNGPDRLTALISSLRDRYPGQPVLVIGHSNGGNVGYQSVLQGGTYDVSGRPDYLIRLGSPILNDTTGQQMDNDTNTQVIDAYDPDNPNDKRSSPGNRVRSTYSTVAGGGNPTPADTANWHAAEVTPPKSDGLGAQQHTSMISPEVWWQLQGPMLDCGILNGMRGRIYNPYTNRWSR